MKSKILLLVLTTISLALSAQPKAYYHPGEYDDNEYRNQQERIQIALVLDVSGSMDGLIDQAKSQLWHIVGGLMTDDDYGYGPRLEIALYEVGNQKLGYRSGYMRQVVPFTTDLDWLSEELFYLRTGGRYEYYGQSIMMATDQLDWSPRHRDLKLMYIAGNESFDQGQVNHFEAIQRAARSGIIVNTIYCGSYQQGIRLGWRSAAEYGNGDYLNIDHNYHIHFEPTSYDDMFGTLNTRLNATYIPYGVNGRKFYQRQKDQDHNAQKYGQVHQSQRTLVKASESYRNDDWDLIDAIGSGRVRLANIPNDDLPPEMRSLTLSQKEKYIETKREERRNIQSEIRTLSRKKVQQEKPKIPSTQQEKVQGETQTLDKAIIQSVKKRQLENQSVPERPSIRPATPVSPVRRAEEVKREIPESRTPARVSPVRVTRTPASVGPVRETLSRKGPVTEELKKEESKKVEVKEEEVKKEEKVTKPTPSARRVMSRQEMMTRTLRR